MAKVKTYYSIRESDTRVHHDNDNCVVGKSIESYVRSSGTENRPLCKECERLDLLEPPVIQAARTSWRSYLGW
jgi:hypothetical protein